MTAISDYLDVISAALSRGDATEHTHRPALKALIESLAPGIVATNEPKRIACGAPDFIVTRSQIPLGYIEAKDVGKRLDEAEKTDQIKRYFKGLSNIILTDYIEFRWFVDGQLHMSVRLAQAARSGDLRPVAGAEGELQQLVGEFLEQKAPTVAGPRELASRMAGLAKIAKQAIVGALRLEGNTKAGTLHQQLDGFRKVLLHEMTEEQFADMYAQTIAYGLFTAKCNAKAGAHLDRKEAAWLLPKTNPFLRSVFNNIAGPDADDDLDWVIDGIANLLDHADIEGILADFGKRTRKEDPVVHFYETFLSQYDPKMREARGVYYTPEPVVSYIVRSVDLLLRRDFGCNHGLADESKVTINVRDPKTKEVALRDVHRVQILDPATGTGTFLYGVINKIYERFASSKGKWASYVSDHLLPRVIGFELLMAPYAVAHLKLGLLLKESGYDIDKDERLGVYMTNTLEEAATVGASLFAQAVADEANAAYGVKKDVPVMVIIGNPPYSMESQNKGQWISDLMQDYKREVVETKYNWDDYTKFIRFAQWRIEQTGFGILAFVTNNSYLNAVTLRQMRESLLDVFDDIYVLNLHGDSLSKEKAPDGGKDENVFDIRQGVAISLFVRRNATKPKTAIVHHADLWGSRQVKYEYLQQADVNTTEWTRLDNIALSSCLGKLFLFQPSALDNLEEYCKYWSVRDLHITSANGVKTERDRVSIHMTRAGAEEAVRDFRTLSEAELRTKYDLKKDSRDWSIQRAKTDIQTSVEHDNYRRILYRPFDVRHTWYNGRSKGFIGTPGYAVSRHMIVGRNIALITTRQTVDTWDALATNLICGHKSCAAYDINTVFPLYVYPNGETAAQQWLDMEAGAGGRHPNLAPAFIEAISKRLGLSFVADGKGSLQATFGPEDIFDYMYAVFHSPAYRLRYAEFLKIDFPRLPLPSGVALFRYLCKLGSELVGLHLMEVPSAHQSDYPVPLRKGDPDKDTVQFVRYTVPTATSKGRVHINRSQYFEGVGAEVWNFRVGGYQVCDKWLKDRKGHTLTFDDIEHYSNLTGIISDTIRLMAEVDAVIGRYGGWPIR